MPVPQHINKFLWGGHLARPKKQARCLFHNTSSFLWGGHLARPQKDLSLAVLHLKLLHNSSHCFLHILPTIKRRNTEITFARCTKTRTGCSHHITSF
jgi:hypothetical protein